MGLSEKFSQYHRIFENTPTLTSATQTAQESHAQKVQEWLELTNELEDASPGRLSYYETTLKNAYLGAKALFSIGDDISAWLGQLRIAKAADHHNPGAVAASHLAKAASYSVYLNFLDIADKFLERMKLHFNENDHYNAAHYWGHRGFSHRLKRQWKEAIPYFEISIKHFEKSSPKELKEWQCPSREDLICNRLMNIADCWINLGWKTEGKEKWEHASQAQRCLDRVTEIKKSHLEESVVELNQAELNLIAGNIEKAKRDLDYLISVQTLTSMKTATMRPAAFFISARLSYLEGDTVGMISYLSRALAESAQFPDAYQETLVVDNALDLVKSNITSREQMNPFLEAMIMMLEAKDWYTGRNHSKKVSQFALKLWDLWNPGCDDPSLREDIYWAGLLHDIGKLRLPRSLLTKIAPLSDEEWMLIRYHPRFSQEILENFGLPRIAKWAGEHHQNAKGSGYPGDTPASDIGMCIGIADCLEAATSPNRKYKKPKTLDRVIWEIQEYDRHKYPDSLIQATGLLRKL